MRKALLVFMLFLLPLQYTWAMAALYDTHSKQDSQAHFGHHEEQPCDHDDTNTQTAKCHDGCGFVHLLCLEFLSHHSPSFLPDTNQYLNQFTFHYHSPPANALERPNWMVAV